jgi:BRK domain
LGLDKEKEMIAIDEPMVSTSATTMSPPHASIAVAPKDMPTTMPVDNHDHAAPTNGNGSESKEPTNGTENPGEQKKEETTAIMTHIHAVPTIVNMERTIVEERPANSQVEVAEINLPKTPPPTTVAATAEGGKSKVTDEELVPMSTAHEVLPPTSVAGAPVPSADPKTPVAQPVGDNMVLDSNTDENMDGDNVDDDDEDEEAGDEGADHPYIGKLVKICKGLDKGIEARIVRIHLRGWWTLDHENLRDKLIPSRKCRMLEPVSEEEMMEYCEKRGMKYRGQPSTMPEEEGKEHAWGDADERGASVQTHIALGLPRARHEKDGEQTEESESKRSRLDTGVTITMNDIMDAAGSPNGVYCLKPSNLRETQRKRPQVDMLPPISIEAVGRVDDLPHGLSHLHSTTRVKIFDRKTGKILEGDDAVQVQHLPGLLQRHAEYEPIIPPPNIANGQPIVRQGRSGRRIRVSSDVIPQHKITSSQFSGRDVTITDGPHRGAKGSIQGMLEGGWYAVEGILPNLPLIIGASNLAMEPLSTKDIRSETDPSSDLPPESVMGEFINSMSKHFMMELKDLRKQLKELIEEEKNLILTLECSNALDPPSESARKRQQKQLDYLKNCRQKLERELAQFGAARSASIGMADGAFSEDSKRQHLR